MNQQEAPTIRLSQFLKWVGLCGTGGEAKIRILEGEVAVNGEIEKRRGRVLRNGDRVVFNGEEHIVALDGES